MPEHSTELPAGRRLGRYLVRRRLGEGGFARVYLAWDPDLEIEVAIKLPRPPLAADPAAIERFRREATTAARLRHPNVVTVLTVGRLEETFDGVPTGTPYLVMDFLPESLNARLVAARFLSEPEWLRIGEEVARGLAYAHAQGVVHRDVKPDNILFGRHGEAVVTDFGIARAVIERASPSSRSIIIGTPEYFSPEQARGLPLDGRTDVYALGVTLYRAATGTLPFAGTDWYAVMRQHVEDTPPPPRSINPEISVPAEAAILRCLAKAPEQRFQNAAEIAATLAMIAHPGTGEHALATAGPTIDLAAPTRMVTVRRRPPATARFDPRILAASAVFLGSAAIGMWTLTRQPPAGDAIEPVPPAAAVMPSLPVTVESLAIAPPGRDSAMTNVAIRPTASLTVIAPPGAVLALNGRAVGSGTWRSEAIPIGRYEIRASIPSLPNCSGASALATVDLARNAPRTVRLSPTGCGLLALNVTPVPAHFTLSGEGGGALADGNLPLTQPLVVPEGIYRLVIEARACQRYDDRVRVPASVMPHVERIRLFCP